MQLRQTKNYFLNAMCFFSKVHYNDLRIPLIRKLAKEKERTKRESGEKSEHLASLQKVR